MLCAVSGGADSLALMTLAVAAGCDVTACHVDHGLRPGSHTEAQVVADAAAMLGAAFRSVQVTVTPGPNLEARARHARREVLGPDAATGHTADDQAETLLLNLLRGAGPAGLGAMRPGPRHPILALRRSDTEQVCVSVGLQPVHDPSNVDPAFRRNRIRHEVIPLLNTVAERDIIPLLARSATQVRAVADHVEHEAARLVPDPSDVASLRAVPAAVATAALQRWLRQCSPHGYPPDAQAVARVLEVVAGSARATDVGGGWQVRRRQGRLRLVSPDSR